MSGPRSLAEVLDLAAASAEYALHLDFDGFRVRFTCNSPELQSYLADYYKHFLGDDAAPVDCVVEGVQCATPSLQADWQVNPPGPGKTKVKEHYAIVHGAMVHGAEVPEGKLVKKVQTGVHLLFAHDRNVCAGPLNDNPNQVINFINNMHLDHLLAPQGQLFHAAGVCRQDFGIGMAGQSGKGKSTLALRLLSRGCDLVSNDRLVVYEQASGELRMHGIPKYPRINPGTVINQPELRGMVTPESLTRYEAMPADELWELEEKYDGFVEEAFGCAFKLSATMRLFVAIDWDRRSNEPTRLTQCNPAERTELVATIMKSPGVMLPHSSKRIGEAAVENYVQLLAQCEFRVLEGGVDFDAAADQIAAVLPH